MTEAEWLASTDPQRILASRLANVPLGHGDTRPSDRKLRLFACACCRQVWDKLVDDAKCPQCKGKQYLGNFPDKTCPTCFGTGRINRSRRAVEVAERYADGQATEEELAIACHAAWEITDGIAWSDCRPHFMSWTASGENDSLAGSLSNNVILNPASPAVQAALLREVFGNPFRPAKFAEYWRHANHSAVYCIAQGIYDERAFDRMPILGDALEDAGCDNEEVLRHCRGEERCSGPKVTSGGLGGLTISGCGECGGTGWRPLRGPHVRGCWVVDLILGK